MEKKYAYLGLLSNPMNRTSILVASPIIQLQIIVIHKGLWGLFFQAEIAGFLAMEQLSSLEKTILMALRNAIVHRMIHWRQNVYMFR